MTAKSLIADGVPASFFSPVRHRGLQLVRQPKPDTSEARAFLQGQRDGRANRHTVKHRYARPGLWEAWLRGWREGQKELHPAAGVG
jgi:ribosome modulation factor